MTAAAGRLSRMLALVPWLVAHDGVSIDEAAEHFGVTPAQLEKDLWLVVCSGLPGHGPDQLIDIDFWDDGRIHVIDPQSLTAPVRLAPGEAAALLVGLRLLAQVPGDHDREALHSATERLAEAAGDALPDADRVLVAVPGDPGAQEAAGRALDHGRALRIRYAGAGRSEATDRIIDPRRLQVRGGLGYLEAWCRLAGAVRTFRLDRILTAEVLDEAADPHEQVTTVERPRLAVTLDIGPEAEWIREAHACTVVGEGDEGRTRVILEVADPRWLVRLVLSAQGHAVVVAPDAVRSLVADVAREALAAYQSGDPGLA